jgi:DNA modification methylase
MLWGMARNLRRRAGTMPRQPRKAKTGPPLRLNRSIDTRVVYCGDNLEVLRQIPEGAVDLIYIDPPFYSGRNYEILWGESWERRAFEDRHESIGEYVRFMEERCFHLHRVLRETGTFYLHCDWHACHPLKIMLDRIFGENRFLNEIVWKRSDAKSDVGQGAKHYPRMHDTILVYTKGEEYTFNPEYRPLPETTVAKWYRHVEEGTGRRYNKADVTGPGGEAKGCPVYEWKGITRAWRYTKANMERLEKDGRLVYSKSGMVYQKRYLDESKGVLVGSWWDDIDMLRGIHRKGERLGYPTQKPLALLERILRTSSNPGDVVLDAFCGCGTTLEAAESLGRRWIGIDFSPTACKIMATRLEQKCKIRQNDALWKADRGFIVKGMPTTAEQLQKLDPFDFQNWAIIAIDGYPNKKRVGDMGIDGRLLPANAIMGAGKGASGEQLEFTLDMYFPIQAKQVQRVGRPDIDKFETAMRRIDAHRGYFVAFGYTRDAMKEIARFEKHEGRTIIALTVDEILEEQERAREKKLG